MRFLPPEGLPTFAAWTFCGGFIGGAVATLALSNSILAVFVFSILGGCVAVHFWMRHGKDTKPESFWAEVFEAIPIGLGGSWVSVIGGMIGMMVFK
jgi:uncharacterized membrane protein YfcA